MTAIALPVSTSSEERLSAIRQAFGRFAHGSATMQSELAGLLDQSGKLGGPLAWLRGQVTEQCAAQRAASGLLSGLKGPEAELPAGTSQAGAQALPVDRLDESVRPTLERALEQSRSLSALDPSTWSLQGEESPVLGTALQVLQSMFGQMIHSMLAMPAERERQMHWAEGARAFLDQVESRLSFVVQRSRSLARETALRADWLAWVREAARVGKNNEKPAANLVERLDYLVQEVAEVGTLGADLAKIWWQPVLGENDPAVWVAADGWNLAWIAAEVARLEGVSPQALSASETLHACLLHDVGLVLMPVALWLGESRLARDERRVMETHCRRGEELVGLLMPNRHVLRKAVLWHHERGDGTGYPDGYKGPELSPLSKWLAVLEVYGGLQVARAHRPAASAVDAWRTVHAWARQGLLEASEVARLDLIGPLPAGTLLRFSDGSLGLSGGCVTQGDAASSWVIPLTGPSGQVLPIPQAPSTIDPRQVGSHGRGAGDIAAYHGLERKALLREFCPWLG